MSSCCVVLCGMWGAVSCDGAGVLVTYRGGARRIFKKGEMEGLRGESADRIVIVPCGGFVFDQSVSRAVTRNCRKSFIEI